jgi:hypothetical protein
MFTEPRHGETVQFAEWLIRACQERGAVVDGDTPDTTLLLEAVPAAPGLFTQEISVRGRIPKTASEDRTRRQLRSNRTDVVTVRATSVTLLPPKRAGQQLPPVPVNVVLVREGAAPQEQVPIEWVLVTTLPIDDVEAVRTVIAYYSVR